jgi:hypothetical protein
MGWHINLVKNTVKIDSAIALALYNCGADVCFSWEEECNFPMLEGIIYDGKLVFNSDHMEHMDYVWQPEVLDVLKQHRVKGDICFSSNDGDNRGQSWGYRFDGEGGMVQLTGKKSAWEEVRPKVKKTSKAKAKKSKKVRKDIFEGVRAAVDNEGFDYAFRNYSSFEEVPSKKFHALREAYRKAADELEAYIQER